MHVLFCFLNSFGVASGRVCLSVFLFLFGFFLFLVCHVQCHKWTDKKQSNIEASDNVMVVTYVGGDDGDGQFARRHLELEGAEALLRAPSVCPNSSSLRLNPATQQRKLILAAFIRNLIFFGHYPKLMTIGEGWKVDRLGYLNSFAWGSLGLGGVRASWHADKRATTDLKLKFLNVISCVFVLRYPGVVKQSNEWVHNVQTQGAACSCK